MVPDASLLGAQHIKIGLASLSSQTLLKIEMGFLWNERSRVINISWDNFLRMRSKINKLKLKMYTTHRRVTRPQVGCTGGKYRQPYFQKTQRVR